MNVLELNLALDRLDKRNRLMSAQMPANPRAPGDLAVPARHRQPRADRQPQEARPARAGPQPGDVRGGDRLADHDRHVADPGVRRQAARRRQRARPGTRSRSSIWLWLTVVFANMAEAFAEGRGRAQADTLRSMRKETVAKMRDGSTKAAAELTRGDVVVVPAGRADPGRRHGDRGHRDGRRVGDHGRVRAGDPRVRRRPQRGHGRHARDLR